MKKSEKIELRVSLEEKAALTELAQREGRPASEILRRLLTTYTQASSQQGKPPMTTVQKIAYMAGGAVLAAAGVFAFAQATEVSVVAYTVEIDVMMPPEQGAEKFHKTISIRTALSINTEFPTVLMGENKETDMIWISAQLTSQDDDMLVARFDFCVPSADGCEPLATPSLTTQIGAPTSLRVQGAEGHSIVIGLNPLTD